MKTEKLTLNGRVEFLNGAAGQQVSRFQIRAYTGAVIDRIYGKMVIDLAGMSARQQMPVLRDHRPDRIVGYSDRAWKEPAGFHVAGKFSESTETAKEVRKLAQEGFPWQASIGVQPLKTIELKPGTEMVVNGQTVTGPMEVWTESEVRETSFVPMGADGDTEVSTLGTDDPQKKNIGRSHAAALARLEPEPDPGDDIQLMDWDSDPKLREEFDGDFESFKGYIKARDAGLCRA